MPTVEFPQIVHEDEVLLAVNRAPLRALGGGKHGSEEPDFLSRLRERTGGELYPIFSLDPEASGCAIFAKSKRALDLLSGQFQGRTVSAVFLALVHRLPVPPQKFAVQARTPEGEFKNEFSIEVAVVADSAQPDRYRVSTRPREREAISRFSVTEKFGEYLWLTCRPETWRPQQLRVHLAASGAPIVGDSRYAPGAPPLLLSQLKRGYKGAEGSEKPMLHRLALHCAEIVLRHPARAEALPILAPLAGDMTIALRNLKRYSRPNHFRRGSGKI